MGADIPSAEPMRSAYLSLTVDTEQEAERVYTLLMDGGEIFMKLDKTPLRESVRNAPGPVRRSWMLLHQPADPKRAP